MKLATVAVSPFKGLWALMPTSLSETTEVGSLLPLCLCLSPCSSLPLPPPSPVGLTPDPHIWALHSTESGWGFARFCSLQTFPIGSCLRGSHPPYRGGVPGDSQHLPSPTDGSASLLLPSRPAPPRQAPYLVPIELWDWGQPAMSSTATVTVSVCRCRPDGSVASCRPEAQLSPAGLSTGALLAIITCVGTLLGESGHRGT